MITSVHIADVPLRQAMAVIARPPKADAVGEGTAKPFHHVEAYIRFRPLEMSGALTGRNPLAEASHHQVFASSAY